VCADMKKHGIGYHEMLKSKPLQGFFEEKDRVITLEGRRGMVLDLLNDGEWHKGSEISGPDVGGSEGLRRLRELREAGYTIDKIKDPCGDGYLYRLT